MITIARRLAPLALFATLSVASAQVVDVGNPAPDFGGEWYNHPDARLTDFEGRVVYLEFWGSYLGDFDRSRVSDVKRLVRQYEGTGLEILVVAHCDREELEEKVEDWWIDFPIVLLDKSTGDDIERSYGGQAALVDHEGVLRWRASKWGLRHDHLDDMLEHASVIPVLPDDYSKINKHLYYRSLNLGKAHKEITKALDREPEDEHLARAMEQIDGMFRVEMSKVDELIANLDYGVADARLEQLRKAWKGSLPEQEVKVVEVELQRNDEAKQDIKAYVTFVKAEEQLAIRKYDKARTYYEKVLRNFPGTKCAERAERTLAEIKGKS